MRVQVLQHVPFESPGLIADEVRKKGYSLLTKALYAANPLPSVADFDMLIIMGGPMSVHDVNEYTWLQVEKALIAASIRQKKKVLGICLGAQLIAEACGGRVYQAAQKEIGWWPVKWVGGTMTTAFHWHGETFDLPEGAELLASTEVCVNQAFRIGERVLGIQFHPEVTEEILRGMVENEGEELAEGAAGNARFIQSGSEILGRAQGLIAGEGMTFLSEWL